MKASDLLVKCLENEGVEYIFGIPGEENLDFLESLRDSKIKLVLTRHEQGAGFIAAVYGRLTGKVGVALSTLGPGATNFVTPCSYALLGGMPVLFLTGQKPIKKSKQGKFQILDTVNLFKPVTKAAEQIVDGNNIPHIVREFFRISHAEKPGPVYIELPEDIAAENVDRTPFRVTKILPAAAAITSLEVASKMIMEAKHPLLLIASGANRNKTHKALRNFVDKTGLYFFTTQMGKGAVDERHPKCLGTTALSDNDYIHCAISKADLIINVGHDVSEKPPFFMEQNGSQKIIHINYTPAEMDDVYFPDHEVIGCIGTSLNDLSMRIKLSDHCDNSYYERVKTEIDQHVYSKSDSTSFPNIPQRIVSDVRDALKDKDILSLDNGMYKLWFARNYRAHEPNTVLLDNALASMGAGLPGAIAASLVHPDRNVVAICGDGGFMMNSQEIETAIRLKLNLTVLIIRDDAFGMIRWKQSGLGFPDFGLEFQNPDFIKYAQSYGAKGARITETGQLTEVLKNCFSEGGVHLVEVPVDYSENEELFLKELKEKTCIL